MKHPQLNGSVPFGIIWWQGNVNLLPRWGVDNVTKF